MSNVPCSPLIPPNLSWGKLFLPRAARWINLKVTYMFFELCWSLLVFYSDKHLHYEINLNLHWIDEFTITTSPLFMSSKSVCNNEDQSLNVNPVVQWKPYKTCRSLFIHVFLKKSFINLEISTNLVIVIIFHLFFKVN